MKFREKMLASARAFAKEKNIEDIINLCYLSPAEDWHEWFDEDKNLLQLQKNASCHIYPSNYEHLMTTDIYRKSRPFQIANASYWGMFCFKKNLADVFFLGIDERLRLSCFEHGLWVKNKLPLTAKLQPLKKIIENMSIPIFKEIKLSSYDYVCSAELNMENIHMIRKVPNSTQIFRECGYAI